MKAYVCYFALSLLLVSCGKGSSSGLAEKSSQPLALEAEEEALCQKLLQKKTWNQKKLLLTLVEVKASERTFKVLDQKLNINCHEEQGICTLSAKGN